MLGDDTTTPPPLPDAPPAQPTAPRLRAWHLAALALVLFGVLRFALPPARVLTADEVDTLRGGHHLVDLMTTAPHDPRLPAPGVRARLKAGFETTATNPRLSSVGDSSARRAAIEAPLPRWLAALGIGVLPTDSEASNLERARTSSALAVALGLAALVWATRRRGPLFGATLVLGALGLPGLWDAAASAGYGAAAFFASALLLASIERLLQRERGSALVGVALGLCLGVHPMALALVVPVFSAWAIARRPTLAPDPSRPGLLRLPDAPLGLFAVPVLALVVLVLTWPTLWNETGKRLGAWLLDYGSLASPPHEVLGQAYDQASGRAGPAWTALLQWIAWTPIPLLALWSVGLARALRAGREGLWAPIAVVATLLVVGGLDGGLFGARLSLLPLLWAPTLLTAADGALGVVTFARHRMPRLLPANPAALGALVVLAISSVPIFQSARGTTFGLARSTGAELREPVPRSLLVRAAELVPHATVHAVPRPASLRPAFEAAREDLELDLSWGDLAEAELVVVLGPPPPELAPRLVEELARDARPGLTATLWRLGVPGALDNDPTLPH